MKKGEALQLESNGPGIPIRLPNQHFRSGLPEEITLFRDDFQTGEGLPLDQHRPDAGISWESISESNPTIIRNHVLDLDRCPSTARAHRSSRCQRFAGRLHAGVERAEEFVEQIALDEGHDGVFRRGVAVGHEVAQRGVTVVSDGLVETDRRGEAVQLGVLLVEVSPSPLAWRSAARRLAERSPGIRMRLAFWSSARPMA